MQLVFLKKIIHFKLSYSTFIFVDFHKITFCKTLLFEYFVLEIEELLTADIRVKDFVYSMNSNSHYKIKLKLKPCQQAIHFIKFINFCVKIKTN